MTITAEELFPNLKFGMYGVDEGYAGYQAIVEAAGEVLVQEDDKDYQGDTFALIRKDGKLGFLMFGWGSCSGCDAMEAANSYEDLNDIIESIHHNIKWFDAKEEAVAYLTNREANRWEFNSTTYQRFVGRVIEVEV